MAQDLSISENATKNPADMHKGSGVAVRKARWYIAECAPRQERACRTMLQKEDYEVFVASRVETHVYKSRNRRQVEKIVIPGKVFVHTEENQLMEIMLAHSSIYRFLLNRASSPNQFGNKPYAFVPDEQMQQLQYMLGKAERPVYFTEEDFKLNQRVKVVRGPLAGYEAFFHKMPHVSYIVLKIEMGIRHYAYTEVSVEDVLLIK